MSAIVDMARTTRAAAASKPVKVEKVDEETPKTSRKAKLAQRRRLYKKTKRARQIEAIKTALRGADDSNTKKELVKLQGQIFKPKKKDPAELQQLKLLLQKQQEEIETLKKALQGANVPRLEPPASPTVEEAREEPDLSPVEIQEQLFMEVAQSSYDEDADADAKVSSAALKIEQVVEETTGANQAEQMEGVETTTVTTTTTTEHHVEYPTLPSVEGHEAANDVKETIEGAGSPERQEGNEVAQSSQAKEKAGDQTAGSGQVTPAKLSGTPLRPTEEFRDSSVDSNAGTPRNVRRSPRKRAKRRSFAGHSYAV